MPVLIPCPSCNGAIQAPEAMVGKKVRCNKCQAVFILKDPAAQAPREQATEADPLNFAGDSAAGGRRRWYYKCVPLPPDIAVAQEHRAETEAARHLEELIEAYAVDGWEFFRVATITVDILPGCLAGLLGNRGESRRLYVVTFRRPATADAAR